MNSTILSSQPAPCICQTTIAYSAQHRQGCVSPSANPKGFWDGTSQLLHHKLLPVRDTDGKTEWACFYKCIYKNKKKAHFGWHPKILSLLTLHVLTILDRALQNLSDQHWSVGTRDLKSISVSIRNKWTLLNWDKFLDLIHIERKYSEFIWELTQTCPFNLISWHYNLPI